MYIGILRVGVAAGGVIATFTYVNVIKHKEIARMRNIKKDFASVVVEFSNREEKEFNGTCRVLGDFKKYIAWIDAWVRFDGDKDEDVKSYNKMVKLKDEFEACCKNAAEVVIDFRDRKEQKEVDVICDELGDFEKYIAWIDAWGSYDGYKDEDVKSYDEMVRLKGEFEACCKGFADAAIDFRNRKNIKGFHGMCHVLSDFEMYLTWINNGVRFDGNKDEDVESYNKMAKLKDEFEVCHKYGNGGGGYRYCLSIVCLVGTSLSIFMPYHNPILEALKAGEYMKIGASCMSTLAIALLTRYVGGSSGCKKWCTLKDYFAEDSILYKSLMCPKHVAILTASIAANAAICDVIGSNL